MHALIIDDEPQIRDMVATSLRQDGWRVSEAESAESALEMLFDHDWSLVVCDIWLGDADGMTVLHRIKENLPATKVVMMTGSGSASGALDATALVAFDYLIKPFAISDLLALARGDAEQSEKEAAVESSGAKIEEPALVGRSKAFITVMKQVGRVAGTSLPVILTGESGTGKEVVALALHQRSTRADRPFVTVNCGAIPAELIESELFGHQRGAFTGADRDRPGLWEEADGGTVFLDEITETTLAFQVKLLRALQQGEIRRVGSNRTQRVDVRVIAASNRNVESEVKAGRFREDLYYRLNAVSIVLPPLRERKEDIRPLAESFARRVVTNARLAFTAEAFEAMEGYSWPGNIRELENAVVRAAAMCDEIIREKDLPERVRRYQKSLLTSGDEEIMSAKEWPPLSEIEGRYVARVFAHTKGNKQAAARILAVDRKTLERMIKRHNISAPTGQHLRLA
jgi:two-component system, NtrC family, response regulator AtoC